MKKIKKFIKKEHKLKKLTKTQIKKKLDISFSKWVRTQNDHRCLACRSLVNLQCAHVFSRSYLAIRWNENNAVPLCRGCHLFYTFHPIEWTELMQGYLGEEMYELLRKTALSHHKPDYEALKEKWL